MTTKNRLTNSARLLDILIGLGPSGELPAREVLASRLHISIKALEGCLAHLCKTGLTSREGTARGLRIAIANTPFVLKLTARARNESVTGDAIGIIQGERPTAGQVAAEIAALIARNVVFEDVAVRSSPGYPRYVPTLSPSHSEGGVSRIYAMGGRE